VRRREKEELIKVREETNEGERRERDSSLQVIIDRG